MIQLSAVLNTLVGLALAAALAAAAFFPAAAIALSGITIATSTHVNADTTHTIHAARPIFIGTKTDGIQRRRVGAATLVSTRAFASPSRVA
jgi:hypothetical protein